MEITVKKIGESEKEYIEIGCHRKDERVDEIVRFIRSREGILKGTKEDRQYNIPLPDILYIEAVTCGEVSAAVLSKSGKIYTGVCIDTCSTLGICAERNAIFNMLTNGEQVIISRKYVPDIKERLKGGSV